MAPLLDSERAKSLARVDRVAELMDSRYRIPLTNIRVGWDAIGGLVPIAGDAVTMAIAVWIVYESRKLKASNRLIARMAGNVAIDVLIGAVPIIGSIFDIFFRANDYNLKLLLGHIEAELENERRRDADHSPPA